MTTYSAHAEKGQGLTLSGHPQIVHGYNAIVKRGNTTVYHGNLYRTKGTALQVAQREAARYRAYRQEHGEGIEDVDARKRAEREAARKRRNRINHKDLEMYQLLLALASDCELVTDWLPTQAIGRLAQVKAIQRHVETGENT
jgi:hypothetical protein